MRIFQLIACVAIAVALGANGALAASGHKDRQACESLAACFADVAIGK
jgi:hypothetical protein